MSWWLTEETVRWSCRRSCSFSLLRGWGMMEAYSVVFSGSVEEELGTCWPAGAEEDVEEGAILRTHRRRDCE